MPAVIIQHPRHSMDATDKDRFKRAVKELVAKHMDCIDPQTNEMTAYGENPDAFIDLVLQPYDPDDAEVTTPYLGTIVSYEWPDRMANLGERVDAITKGVRQRFTTDMEDRYPKGTELISFTFLGKAPGAWAVA